MNGAMAELCATINTTTKPNSTTTIGTIHQRLLLHKNPSSSPAVVKRRPTILIDFLIDFTMSTHTNRLRSNCRTFPGGRKFLISRSLQVQPGPCLEIFFHFRNCPCSFAKPEDFSSCQFVSDSQGSRKLETALVYLPEK